MYKVVLVHKEDHDVIGEIGSYNDVNEANNEANDYNRKGDRHIGHAIVQATIDGSPMRNGLRLGRTPHPQQQRVLRDYPVGNRLNTESLRPNRHIATELDEESSSEETREVYQRNPSWHQQTHRQPHTGKMFAFLVDQRTKKGIVLEHNRFLQNFLLAHPSYEVKSTGQIHEMISQRNSYLQNRRR